MYIDLKWKIPLILFVILGAAFLAYPLKEKIALGLDLQGGMHLVLEVQTEKAVEASLERIADDIKREIEKEDYEVDRVRADLENKTVTVLMVDAIDLEPVEEIMKNFTAYLKNEGKIREGRGYQFRLSKGEEKRIHENAVNQGLETIRNRVDQFGVSEPIIQAQGERRILVQLPGIKDANRAIKLIGKTARLEFKLLDESITPQTALNGSIPEGDEVLYKREENPETNEITKTPFLVKKRTVLTGETLSGAEVRYDSDFNEPYVAITFNSLGAMIFQEVTRANVKKRLAIILDDNVYSAPTIQEEIAGGRAQITGHSKWSTIKHKKGAADAKRGKIFTKVIKEITVAARIGGSDIDGNPRLRLAIQKAKEVNMPQDNVARAIKKGTGELEGVQYEEVSYEGYGPGGIAIFIEVMTDNKNRTVGELRAMLGKNGGNMGENGCVAWMFEQKGFITIKTSEKGEDELLELVIEAGGEDMKTVDDRFEVTTSVENFESVRKTVEDAGIITETAELTRIPQNTVNVDEKNCKSLLRLMDALEDHDDIQKVYSNFDITDELMATIEQSS